MWCNIEGWGEEGCVQHGFAGGMELARGKSSLFLAVENIILYTSLLWEKTVVKAVIICQTFAILEKLFLFNYSWCTALSPPFENIGAICLFARVQEKHCFFGNSAFLMLHLILVYNKAAFFFFFNKWGIDCTSGTPWNKDFSSNLWLCITIFSLSPSSLRNILKQCFKWLQNDSVSQKTHSAFCSWVRNLGKISQQIGSLLLFLAFLFIILSINMDVVKYSK